MRRMFAAAAIAAIGLAPFGVARAAPADPAAARVEALCNGVVEAVKDTPSGGLQARAHRIQPVVEQNFEISMMAEFAIGPQWAKIPPAQRTQLTAALTRHTAARYAQEFDSYTGQKCLVDPAVQTRGPDKLVKSQIVDPHDRSSVNYRLRQYGGVWKVIDVYYEGVSQLATERADFAGVLASGGAPALVARLNELTAKMR
ncbi:MAG: ABC transporter substrate-binding protein [Alphaproteobacteria bacterium]|nr:ABC transporter substrate-binding protein [Alphaproteobacteria bacterium]